MMVSMLNYARINWPVIPIAPAGKRPVSPHTVYSATTSTDKIAEWLEATPNANIAVPAGAPIGAFVIDVDYRNGGYESLAELTLEHGEFPVTVHSRTAGRGEHYLFQLPKDVTLVGKLRRGIDVLSTGRYFLVEPSVNAEGGRYHWINSPWTTQIANAPSWLLALVERKSPKGIDSGVPASKYSAGASRFAEAEAFMRNCPGAISGKGGHNYTFALAGQLVHHYGLSIGDAMTLMREWNQKCDEKWTDRELERKLTQVASKGSKR